MQIQLIDGRFSIAEVEQLLVAIFKAKITFHEEKIKMLSQSEEDMKHSETRIKKLEETLRSTLKKLRDSGKTFIDMNASIDIDMAPRLQ